MSGLAGLSGGGAYGIDAELAKRQSLKYDPSKEIEAKEWMKAITQKPFPPGSDFHESMKDGVYLCHLMNAIVPGSIKKIEVSKMPFKQMENVSNFIKACRSYGVLEHDLFETVDLFEAKDLGNVISCIFSLGRTCQKKNFSGPTLGPRSSTPNVRVFEVNNRNSFSGMTMMSMGSSQTMERSQNTGTKSITFGSNASGVGDTTVTSKQTGGSYGTTQRSEVNSKGITFGASAGEKKAVVKAPAPASASKPSSSSQSTWKPPPKPTVKNDTKGIFSGFGKKAAAPAPAPSPFPTKPSVLPPPQAANSGTAPSSRGGGYGLDAELAAKQASKYSYEMEGEAQQWLTTLTKETFSNGFGESLKDGSILCKAINVISPNSVKKIETSKMAFKQMENISNFLKGCRAYGVPEFELFETVDLYEMKDLGVVVSCIHALNRTAVKKGFSGVKLGAKLSVSNVTSGMAKLSTSKRVTAKVLHAYVAAEQGELSIREGKVITVTDMVSDPHGWWGGDDGIGNTGVFPHNYVEII